MGVRVFGVCWQRRVGWGLRELQVRWVLWGRRVLRGLEGPSERPVPWGLREWCIAGPGLWGLGMR